MNEEKKEVEIKKPKTIGVPTQKTFIFKGNKTSNQIDSTINPWLKQQSIVGQTPMLVKLEFNKGLFGMSAIYVYMYNAPLEIKK